MSTFTTTCRQCGDTFEAQRSTARFCSDACRARSNRPAASRDREALELLWAMQAAFRATLDANAGTGPADAADALWRAADARATAMFGPAYRAAVERTRAGTPAVAPLAS
ncbi:hypothetical protein [Curtobacterium sp. MCBD17_003]|uniref:hypothetical protein n=1 Tax=Curtobacterium sp. MCBD17_003 TaxID=2175667 RepID=UPI000DAA778E|nr:hypothetical protein [Curtobacterium sp. MCBD17_003]WIE53434.1 hypothetical protein DEI88_009700 [Curtobacterium sp. MCBD17_003]